MSEKETDPGNHPNGELNRMYELNKIKKQVDNAEATKAKAISELESAKEILQNLITKLANVSQCKQSTTAAAQVERNRSRRFDNTVSLKAMGYESK
ncbi:hypothetical protein Fmac_014427 [Flemingia macrophylla]|uniref:Uncharacterized protein n=1 Tax=Flemingia macrophylla TaxID=520843 RepID=A0ABD1MBR5_9FABA